MKLTKFVLPLVLLFLGSGFNLGFAQSAQNSATVQLPNLGETVSKDILAREALKKDAVCTKCHDESETAPVLSIYQTKHGLRGDSRSPTCQSCHGQSEKHVKGDPVTKVRVAPDFVFKKGAFPVSDDKERSGQCLNCHNGTKRNHWDGATHQNNGVACNSCHTVHKPQDKVLSKLTQPEVCFTCHKEQRVDTKKISHHPILEGKVSCSDCHNPHGSPGPKLMKKNTVNETCFQCHAEKRGPFLFEHQPVVEDCANCHNPHGSNITPLLKSRPPFMCQECHDGPHASQSPVGPSAAGKQAGLTVAPNKNVVGRACMNCHSMVHGSNSPAGGYLQR